jgi:ribosomal protein S18 acetylase RimI-like enzyme
MESQIKPAVIDNLEAIQKLNQMLFEKEYADFDNTLNRDWAFSDDGTEYFKYRITKDDGCAFVAYVDNEIVGYLAGGLMDNNKTYRILPNSAELENMFVLEKCRGLGVGSKLYQAFADWCKSKDVSRLRVVASAQNSGGINFYRKNGFVDYDLILEADI